jgi:hypothetical protein
VIKIILLNFLLLNFALAQDVSSRLKFKAQMDFGITHISTDTKATKTAAKSSSSFNQVELRPTLYYYPFEKIAIGLYYFQTTLIEDYNTSGFGGALKWHFLSRGTISESTIDNKKIIMTPTFSPYMDIGFKRQSFEGETIVVKYSGFEVGLGADWHMKNNYYINMCLRTSSLASGTSRSVFSQSLFVGFGKAI